MNQTLHEQIWGRPKLWFIREFVTNSAVFPLFDAIRSIATEGFYAYLTELPHYLLFLGAFLQAWIIGKRQHQLKGWERGIVNLIAPVTYTILDILLESPHEFFTQPYHWLFWIYSIGIAVFYSLENYLPQLKEILILLHNIWLGALFAAQYILAEITVEVNMPLTQHEFSRYWSGSTGHQYIVFGALILGMLLGISEVQREGYIHSLQRIAQHLRRFSEWTTDSRLLTRSLENPDILKRQRVERTVLFMDIRGFTQWSESHSPEMVVAMLNAFYEEAEQIILKHNGYKPRFIGDEVMAWFVAPEQAIAAGVELMEKVTKLLRPFHLTIGIGIHRGLVVAGLLGSTQTQQYDLIGDTVNIASRLTAAAQPGTILISDSLKEWLPGELLPQYLRVKGKKRPLTVFTLQPQPQANMNPA